MITVENLKTGNMLDQIIVQYYFDGKEKDIQVGPHDPSKQDSSYQRSQETTNNVLKNNARRTMQDQQIYNQQWSEGGEEDDVNSVYSGSEDDNGHVDIDLDHDKSEKNKPNYAKPKPGQLKAGKLTAALILNNRVQAKRMVKSRIMNKLKKNKNKLLTEQPY
ncbi:unnamed protein product [Mytilus edulis]|uniref:Uncharacterized protein n=1 Tax=Mytilus edulis TaxID=6550 RepID=A0A8S3PZI3_MYTED|nr:unnamed protein product [Mytilus edulis]